MFFRCFFCTVRLSIFERFVFPKGSKFNRLVWDSLEIWKCGLYFIYPTRLSGRILYLVFLIVFIGSYGSPNPYRITHHA